MEFLYKNSALVAQERISMSAELLKQVRGNLRQATFAKDYSNPESFINLPQDENILKSITRRKTSPISSTYLLQASAEPTWGQKRSMTRFSDILTIFIPKDYPK